MAKKIDSKIPAGPVPEKWKEYKAHQRLVNPKKLTCVFRILLVVLTLSLLRVVSTPLSAIRTMVTLFTVCSTIP